jgi:hypothetical protein
MKRLAAAAMMLFLLSIHAPPAQAADSARASTFWDADQVVNSTLAFYENDTLVIGPGVNVSFVSGPDVPNATRPMLAVTGALSINGTAERPVRLTADENLWLEGDGPDCINIYTDGRADRLSVRNASFSDIVFNLYFTGGEFWDCRFERCDVNMLYSGVSFWNCTFIYSTVGFGISWDRAPGGPRVNLTGCRFDGRDPASHPPLPYQGAYPDGPYPRTAVDLPGSVEIRNCSITGYEAAVYAYINQSLIADTSVRDCGQGILLDSAAPGESGTVRGCDIRNCTGFGLFSLGGLRLSGTVIGDCGESGIYCYGPLLMADCTVFNCTNGVSLGPGFYPAPDWLLSGNRIFGCRLYGVQSEGLPVDISGNRFEEGNVSNGLGRLLVSDRVRVSVVDPNGKALSGPSELFWTDAIGSSGSQTIFPEDAVLFNDYVIDNAGDRADLYPYSIMVRRGTVENRTTLPAGVDRLRVVLPVLPDLVPVLLEPDSGAISAGQEVRFLLRLENRGNGPAPESTVAFLVDGKEVDRQRVQALSIRGKTSLYSDSWEATPGKHRVEVRLDPKNEVAEDNETNDNLTAEFKVAATPGGGILGLTGGSAWLALGCSAFLLVVLVGSIILGMARARRLGQAEAGKEALPGEAPGDKAPAEKAPPAPKAASAAGTQIMCPRCKTVMRVNDPERPASIRCDFCGMRLKVPK